MAEPILRVEHLKKYYPVKGNFPGKAKDFVKAVDDVSFQIEEGSTLGLVGESGCGKTTVGRTLLRLTQPTGGQVFFEGRDIFSYNKRQMRALRPKLQMIFQDPFSSLSPRMPIGALIGEGAVEHGLIKPKDSAEYVAELMNECGISPDYMERYPHEFSGGQRQRIAIARALALNPKVIVADEPVSALDVSIQAQIVNLLKELQKKHGLSYLFISHDLSVVEHISDYVGVMYLGSLVEYAKREELFSNPLHPYTQALLSAVPNVDPRQRMNRVVLKGDLPSPANPPRGCKFHTRCPYAREICREQTPALVNHDLLENQNQDGSEQILASAPFGSEAGSGHLAACHFAGEIKSGAALNNP